MTLSLSLSYKHSLSFCADPGVLALRDFLSRKESKGAGDVAQWVKCLSGMQKALGLIPSSESNRCGGACNPWLHVEFEASLDLKNYLRSKRALDPLELE